MGENGSPFNSVRWHSEPQAAQAPRGGPCRYLSTRSPGAHSGEPGGGGGGGRRLTFGASPVPRRDPGGSSAHPVSVPPCPRSQNLGLSV